MWPDAGSGFEADPFSPAGTAQREWLLTQALGRSRYGKLVVWSILGLVGCVLAVDLISAIVGRH
jgi:hypothetical protein